MAKNSLNIPFTLLISLLAIANVMIIKGELKKNRFQENMTNENSNRDNLDVEKPEIENSKDTVSISDKNH